ncbi:MAG: hypothetical protein COY58_09145 [Gammaproteobacteria bacterium CG_4_10_14_0_8_um_filter_38_16]|nr:MAG: hypothetical protein COY58_09145 [Gammaproteobacteria bacterium CG_4_10_14_0_8_um_filter_38_16]PJA04157.1 MAG: hypothetical protein COX72_01460 [Gammaproteobacteria bacterium CG_4_10_14_0_2_um_filter_38_22]PJB10098.1 MAG: hypothetical protein CO120_06795 [Gammaproteobacteria bacterium CG_4_9_14_3_um_filter_38_9]
MKKLLALCFIITATALSGCVYHNPFEQGNALTLSKVQSIHTGMTSAQVVGKLGSPVLKNIYADQRMSYVYTQQPTRSKTIVKKLVVQFRHDRVVNIRTEL